jgi:protein SCO1/2
MLRGRLTLGPILLVLMLGGCRGPGQEHDVAGLVLKVDARSGIVTVSHDPISMFMDAMVMPFTAADPAELTGVRPGDRIAFRLRVQGDRSTIDRVRILSAAPAEASISTPALRSVPIGSAIPAFTLTDQHGQRVSMDALRGKVVVTGFIYTRCPLPDYCPRVMTHLSVLRDKFASRLGTDLVLLTVTFDPKHDTPGTLKVFGEQYGANVPGWHLLTGTAEEIEQVCAAFGVEYYPDEGMITHTLQIAVIDREGRLAATAEGKEYSARQLADLVDVQLR